MANGKYHGYPLASYVLVADTSQPSYKYIDLGSNFIHGILGYDFLYANKYETEGKL